MLGEASPLDCPRKAQACMAQMFTNLEYSQLTTPYTDAPTSFAEDHSAPANYAVENHSRAMATEARNACRS